MALHVFVRVPPLSSFEYTAKIKIAGANGISTFNFLKNHHTVFKAAALFTFKPAVHKGSSFSTSF